VILVDTNVLLDVFADDPDWSDWSQHQLDSACATDSLAINAVIYSELSIGFARIEELEAVIEEASLQSKASPGKPCSSRARRTFDTGAAEEPNAACFQTFTSARTPP